MSPTVSFLQLAQQGATNAAAAATIIERPTEPAAIALSNRGAEELADGAEETSKEGAEHDGKEAPGAAQADKDGFEELGAVGEAIEEEEVSRENAAGSASARGRFDSVGLLAGTTRRGAGMGRQLGVLLHKRWLCAKRDLKAIFTQQLLPVALVSVQRTIVDAPCTVYHLYTRTICQLAHATHHNHTRRPATIRRPPPTHAPSGRQVALVMLILGINLPIAGPRIQMHAALYEPRSELVHNVPSTTIEPNQPSPPFAVALDYLRRDSDLRYVDAADCNGHGA